MGDFLNNYPETSNQNSYPTASTRPATSTLTSAFGSTNDQESQQVGNTSYANSQIDPQLVSNSFNTANAGKQSSYGQNQAMASYDMQDGQNQNTNNNMNYDPQLNTFNSNMGGYQNNYSDMSYGSANQQQQHAQQQQHFYDRQQQQGSGFQREVSDNFGTVSAGPPSPGKMDMLPHGHTNHYTSSATNPPNSSIPSSQQQQQKTRPSNANAHAGGEYDGASQASHLARAPTTKGSSTTSEFTKRKNWSQRIVEEMQDVLHVLSPSGIFLFISPSIYEITGYTPEELVGRGITDFIERDDIDNFTRDFSESIQTNQALTTYIRFRRKDEQGVLFEMTGQPYYTTATSSPNDQKMARTSSSSSNTNDGNSPADATMASRKPPPSSSETVCKCFFAMARLYPGKNNAMLDSFLELKMENEKLRERLAEIYREIEGDNVEANIVAGTSIIDTTASISTMGSEGQNEPRQISGYPSRLLGQNQQQQQQPIQPSPSNPYAMSTENEVPKSATSSNFPSTFYNYPTSSAQNPYSTQNLQQIQPNNNNNNNNQYNADASTSQLRGTTINQDQLLVSSAGLLPSSGNTYGALGIGISNNAHRNTNSSGPSNQYTSNNAQKGASNQEYAGDTSMRDDGDPANKKKKPKKQRVDEGEFVCRDCGTVDSPEWRRGPQGPKTLCNACGLRWAKKNKQSRTSIGGMEGIV